MNIEDLLNDLKGQTENESTIAISAESFTNSPGSNANADKHISVTEVSNGKSRPFVLEKKTLEKFNTLCDLMASAAKVKSMVKLDRGFALEVFTMVGIDSATNRAKLTTAPSEVNKAIVETKLEENRHPVISPEILEVLKAVDNTSTTDLLRAKETLDRLSLAVDTLKPLIEKVKASNPVITTTDGVNHYLLTDEIHNLLCIDDTKLDYTKYSGKLVSKLLDVTIGAGAINTPGHSDKSLIDICTRVIGTSGNLCSAYTETVLPFIASVKEVVSEGYSADISNIATAKTAVGGIEAYSVFLESIERVDDYLERKDGFNKLVELLEFLD